MKFLYIEPDEDIRDIYAMKLEADFSATIISVATDQEAYELFLNEEGRPEISLVLIDTGVASEYFPTCYNFFNKTHNIPFFIIHDGDSFKLKCLETFESDHSGNRALKKPIQPEIFRRTVLECLSTKNNNLNWIKNAEHGHNKVKISNFLKFNLLPCDAFIRLGDAKFVKLIHAEELYTTEIIKRYEEKNVEYLYVRQEDYPVLANTGIQTLISLYDRKTETASLQQLNLDALESIHNAIHDIGLTKEAAELTKKTIVSSAALAKRVRSIADLLNKMKSSGSYIYDHSMKMTYICTAIAKHTEWGSDSTIFKLSLSCTMHDMTLDNDDLARIETLTDPRLEMFSPAQVEAFKNHPQDAAKLIKDSKEFPPDVDFIVAQHHERPDGSGFPRGLMKLRIAPLSCVFILAHEFVSRVEELGGVYNQENRDRVYQELSQEMYTMGNFKKPFAGLRSAFNLAPKEG